ncbi:MAG: hypothetical protein AABY11_01215, partial [archaeon]
DLNSVAAGLYNAKLNGTVTRGFLGDTNRSGLGVQLVNVDNNAWANDLLIVQPKLDSNISRSGSVFLLRDIHDYSRGNDLNSDILSPSIWKGATLADAIGDSNSSGISVQLIDVDSNAYTNDISIVGVSVDANGITNNGAVYLLKDIAAEESIGVDDYSFTLLFPLSGCTVGKGNLSGGNNCQRIYFEATELSGATDQNKVNPEGQSEGVPFLLYDNQSTSSSDINILLDLNESLPATHVVKVSVSYSGWYGTCSGNTDGNCLTLGTTAANAGKAFYSAGTQDLNLFIWTDFVNGSISEIDRNLDSNSISST